MLAGAFLGALTNGWPALVIYLAVSLAYNFWFKEKSLIDVFTLAGLYTLRLFGGSLAGGYGMSLWLLAFSSFLFLSLAIIKRISELRRLRGLASASRAPRRGYTTGTSRSWRCWASRGASLRRLCYRSMCKAPPR
jgi:4-hydroxybenzoate polyprenyltransferase